jgi:hypothetical protein
LTPLSLFGDHHFVSQNMKSTRVTRLAGVMLSLFITPLTAQEDPLLQVMAALPQLTGSIPTYYSEGSLPRARQLQSMLQEGVSYYREQLSVETSVSLALLGPAEWNAINPRYPGGAPYTLFLPGVSRGTPQVMYLPSESGHGLDGLVQKVWEKSPELVALGIPAEILSERFVALVGFHELGHVYARQYMAELSENWFDEFMATYLAYAFLRDRYPEDARVWQLLCHSFVEHLEPTRTELGAISSGVGVETYVWFQASLQMRVDEVYENHGLDLLPEVRRLRQERERSPHEETLMEALERFAPGFLLWEDRYHRSPEPPG